MNRNCPRCGGWLIVEDNFIHCLGCGCVVKDEPPEKTDFIAIIHRGEMFQKQVKAVERWKGETELTKRYDPKRFGDD